jgi:hypothetical protein
MHIPNIYKHIILILLSIHINEYNCEHKFFTNSAMSSKMLRISMVMKEYLAPLHSDYLKETK